MSGFLHSLAVLNVQPHFQLVNAHTHLSFLRNVFVAFQLFVVQHFLWLISVLVPVY